MQREFTATVYILDENKVLLVRHKKYAKWMPPGGHLLPNELPHEAAIREALEEAGVEIEIISQENISLHTAEARTIPRPHLCLLEEIPTHKNQSAHQHIDMVYLARPLSRTRESKEVRWFNRNEIESLQSGADLFEDCKQLLLVGENPLLIKVSN